MCSLFINKTHECRGEATRGSRETKRSHDLQLNSGWAVFPRSQGFADTTLRVHAICRKHSQSLDLADQTVSTSCGNGRSRQPYSWNDAHAHAACTLGYNERDRLTTSTVTIGIHQRLFSLSYSYWTVLFEDNVFEACLAHDGKLLRRDVFP